MWAVSVQVPLDVLMAGRSSDVGLCPAPTVLPEMAERCPSHAIQWDKGREREAGPRLEAAAFCGEENRC